MMAKRWVFWVAVGGVAVGLSGCSSLGTPNGPGVASLASPPLPAAAPAPAPVVYGAFLDGPTVTKLSEADRTAALEAEDGALASGERRTWKGSRGIYGFVAPGPSTGGDPAASGAAPGECRSFTSTIYFAGRPQTGKGTGCRDAGGSWHVTS